MDRYSRFLVAIPVVDIRAETLIVAIMKGWIYKFGIPEKIHSDRGTAFTSEKFRGEMLQQMHDVTDYLDDTFLTKIRKQKGFHGR